MTPRSSASEDGSLTGDRHPRDARHRAEPRGAPSRTRAPDDDARRRARVRHIGAVAPRAASPAWSSARSSACGRPPGACHPFADRHAVPDDHAADRRIFARQPDIPRRQPDRAPHPGLHQFRSHAARTMSTSPPRGRRASTRLTDEGSHGHRPSRHHAACSGDPSGSRGTVSAVGVPRTLLVTARMTGNRSTAPTARLRPRRVPG